MICRKFCQFFKNSLLRLIQGEFTDWTKSSFPNQLYLFCYQVFFLILSFRRFFHIGFTDLKDFFLGIEEFFFNVMSVILLSLILKCIHILRKQLIYFLYLFCIHLLCWTSHGYLVDSWIWLLILYLEFLLLYSQIRFLCKFLALSLLSCGTRTVLA